MALLIPLQFPRCRNLKTLKASTLFETLISMSIIMMCFGISLSIYINVMDSNNNMKKLKAHLMLNKLVMETKQDNLFIEQIETDIFIIKRTLHSMPQSEKLKELRIVATDKNAKPLATHRELIVVTHEKN